MEPTSRNRPEPERRAERRAPVRLALKLIRRRGSPVNASTIDLGVHGARIAAPRPLSIDELLAFELSLGESDGPVSGRASVMREHAGGVYVLRFNQLSGSGEETLSRFVSSHL